jgi:putative oxidoreductase
MSASQKIQALGLLLARILIGALFIAAGVFRAHAHNFYFPFMAGVGARNPEVNLPLAYVIELGATGALIAGWKTRWAACTLVFYTVIVTVFFHGIAGPDDAEYFAMLSHVVKNLSVCAGLLTIAVFGAGPLSVDALASRSRRS